MYVHWGCALLWSIQPLPLLSLTPLPSAPQFSTAFNTHPYIHLNMTLCHRQQKKNYIKIAMSKYKTFVHHWSERTTQRAGENIQVTCLMMK
jgi:hypothetical protein